MANGKAEITEINLSNIDVNLTNYMKNITPYTGFQECNSPWIGGLLNNVYRKKINVPEGHKIVRIKNGNIYTLFGTSLYKNYEPVVEISKTSFEIVPYEDPYIKDTGDKLVVTFQGQQLIVDGADAYNYDYTIENNTMYFSYVSQNNLITCYIINNNEIVPVTDNNSKFVIISGHKFTASAIFGYYNISGIISISLSLGYICYKHNDTLFQDTSAYNAVGLGRRGLKFQTPTGFDTLLYNYIPMGISYNNSIITDDVLKFVHIGDNFIAFKDNNGKLLKVQLKENEYPEYNVDDDFIYFNTVSYENTYEFDTDKSFCRSDDYNDRVAIFNSGTSESRLFASGYHQNAIEQNYKDFSTVMPQVSLSSLGSDSNLSFKFILSDDFVHPIDIFLPTTTGGPAIYKGTMTSGASVTANALSKDLSKEGVPYPLESNGNVLYNTPVLMDIKPTYINEKIGIMGDSSYLLTKSQNQEPIMGYYEFTLSEIQNIFLIQGSFYGMNDDYIFSLTYANSVLDNIRVAANKLDLEFLGAFPQYALFYSKLDKSLYRFTGDALLVKVKECYRINEITSVYCDPARLTMIISTDIGTVILYQDQVFLLEDIKTTAEIYYDNNAYVVGDYLLLLSYKEGYEIQPVKFKTSYYGAGANVKSVNDCVYLRLARNNVEKGYIKITAHILNETEAVTKTKTINLVDSMFDKESGTCFIRYQPEIQSGTGFSIEVESTNPVAVMEVSHSPEAIQNSKFNF